MNISSRRLFFWIPGAILFVAQLVVQPLAAREIGPQTNTASRVIPGPGPQATTDTHTPDPRISEAHLLYRDDQVIESLQLFEDVVDEYPENYEGLWGAARSAIAYGLLSRGKQIQGQWYKTAESYARRATEVEPEILDGLYWLLTAKGLLALQAGAKEASELGQEVYDLAHQVLAKDSLHAGAYHALGLLNYRVQKLSFIERFVARTFLGAGVMNLTTWEDAERYLKRAVELRPDYILFHLDLGSMYLNRKRMEEARVQFERALELPLFEPPDTRFQETAEIRLAETFN